MDLIGAKVIVLILLGLVKLGSGLGPLLLVRFVKKGGMQWIENFMAGLMCFGGGVLLATVFIHMLPEVRESLETSMRDNGVDPKTIQGSYPFGELVSESCCSTLVPHPVLSITSACLSILSLCLFILSICLSILSVCSSVLSC